MGAIDLIQVRFHGRGGQGVVVATQVLAQAIFTEGSFTQAFPHFGAERRGAPVAAYLRIDERPVLFRGEMQHPDHLVILDESLLASLPLLADLGEGGWVVVNTPSPPAAFEAAECFRVGAVDANAIALRHGLGSPASPLVNTALLGAFASLTGLVSLEAVCAAVEELVPFHPEANLAAVREAFRRARSAGPRQEAS